MTVITLRPATHADGAFCFRLHKAAMGAYVAAVWGWDEEAQRAYHQGRFDPRRWQIVVVDGDDAGVLVVDQRAAELYLGLIELHPEHQGRGIGGRLVRELIDTAARQGQDLVLDVLVVNTRARSFYRRHGFREVSRHGPDNRKIRMCLPCRRTGG